MTDTALRMILPVACLVLFIGLEMFAPAREPALSLARFGRHAFLALLGSLASRLVLTGGLVGVAIIAQEHSIGLLNWTDGTVWIEVLIGVVVLDLAIWGQHLAMHHVPFLWRLHRVHHSDIVMDVSTALRFHPLEILVSLAFKIIMITALGAPVLGVIIFELMLSIGALFTHANVRLPGPFERAARLVIITPALHLIHHSPNPVETNSNFGFSTSLWDRLFGTLRTKSSQAQSTIGLHYGRAPQDQSLAALMLNPMRTAEQSKATP
jgi:sterol desaturase/sphingolipid hydroxylase (fatty acid hydroxylase superfamily)